MAIAMLVYLILNFAMEIMKIMKGQHNSVSWPKAEKYAVDMSAKLQQAIAQAFGERLPQQIAPLQQERKLGFDIARSVSVKDSINSATGHRPRLSSNCCNVQRMVHYHNFAISRKVRSASGIRIGQKKGGLKPALYEKLKCY